MLPLLSLTRNRRFIARLALVFILLTSCLGAFTQTTVNKKKVTPDEIRALHMTASKSTIFGIVEGLTEYLPISSTGHLILTQYLMHMHPKDENTKKAMDAYEVIIQAGAILAVLFLYFGRVKSVWNGLMGRDEAGKKLGINILVAFLPAAIIGYVLSHFGILEKLFYLQVVVWAWFIGGLFVLYVARKHTDPHAGDEMASITPKKAFAIGLMQCIAMCPGVSRSFATIFGGLLIGLSPIAAVEFSFLLGLVTLTAATVYSAMKSYAVLPIVGAGNLLIGFAVSAIAAFFAVSWMVGYLNRRGFAIFGYYRLAMGLGIGALIYMGYILH